MTKMIELNPYQDISDALDSFVQAKWVGIKALCLREHPNKLGKIREVGYSKSVVNSNGLIIGYINLHILNDKYRVTNLQTDSTVRRFPEAATPGELVNTDYFVERLIDPNDRFQVRLTIKQYENPNIALSNVTFSSLYSFDNTATEIDTAIRTKDQTSLMWKDPGFVLATRDFFSNVSGLLDSWVPAESDVVLQTLCQYGE